MLFELFEVIRCVLALGIVIGGIILVPFIRVGQNPRHALAVKLLWLAMTGAVPWAVILPISIFAYRIGELRRAFPGTNPDYFWQTFQPHWLYDLSAKIAKDLNILLGNPYLLLFLVLTAPLLITGIAQGRGHLRWHDYWSIFLVNSVSWFLICCWSSYFWWND